MTLVLDASMTLAWVFERTNPDQGERANRALQALAGTDVVVPSLWHAEVTNALLVGERRKVIVQAQSQEFLWRLDQLPILTDTAPPVLRRDPVMALARQYRLSAYDACYLDLTLRTAGTLATFDVKLAHAASLAGVPVFQ